jgi:hypothetical protein
MRKTEETQFVHYDRYALAAKDKKAVKGRQTQKSTVQGICGEAMRADGFTDHLENPADIKILQGLDALQIPEILEAFAKSSKAKDGRKFNRFENCLIAGVSSFPRKSKDTKKDDPDFLEWVKASQEALNEYYGKTLKSIIVHYDESNFHIHYYAYNEPKDGIWEPIKGIDPSKDSEKALYQELGREAFKKAGKQVLAEGVKALQSFQNFFWEKAYKPLGLAKSKGARLRRHQGTPKEVKKLLADVFEAETRLTAIMALKVDFEAREMALNEKEKLIQRTGSAMKTKVIEFKEEKEAFSLKRAELIGRYAKSLDDVEILIGHLKTEVKKAQKANNLELADQIFGKIASLNGLTPGNN